MNIKAYHKIYPTHKKQILNNMETAYTQVKQAKNWNDILNSLVTQTEYVTAMLYQIGEKKN